MMTAQEIFEHRFSYLGKDLIHEILSVAVIKDFPPHTELVREGQYVKVIPIVLQGLVKVYTSFEDKELLLYYIQPDQSCIMSFSSSIHQESSKIIAVTEETSTLLLIPSEHIVRWVSAFPSINMLFYKQYDLRYSELVDTIQHLLYYKLDKRLLDYLDEKIAISGKNPVRLSHREIANDLGTAREVISRLIKKFEKQDKLRQHSDGIEMLGRP